LSVKMCDALIAHAPGVSVAIFKTYADKLREAVGLFCMRLFMARPGVLAEFVTWCDPNADALEQIVERFRRFVESTEIPRSLTILHRTEERVSMSLEIVVQVISAVARAQTNSLRTMVACMWKPAVVVFQLTFARVICGSMNQLLNAMRALTLLSNEFNLDDVRDPALDCSARCSLHSTIFLGHRLVPTSQRLCRLRRSVKCSVL
jgi:hypothetical protein